jgi:hypothetical protein
MANFFSKATASRLGAAQNVTTSTTSAASSAFGSQTDQVLLVADVASRIRISDGTPTAVSTDTLLPANTPMIFICTPGQKVAVITLTGTGNLSVTELS